MGGTAPERGGKSAGAASVVGLGVVAEPAASEAFTSFLARDFTTAREKLSSLIPSSSSSSSQSDNNGVQAQARIVHNSLVLQFYSFEDTKYARDLVLSIVSSLPESERPQSAHEFLTRTVYSRDILDRIYAHSGPVHMYNIAVIAYNSERISAAACIADVLYANVEAMEDWLALRTCFLLIDIYLRKGDVAPASTAASYAERIIPSFSASGNTTASDEVLPGAASSGGGPASVTGGSSSENEVSRPGLFPVAPVWAGRVSAVLEPPVSYDDAKFCMHIYNARLSAALDATKNLRKEAKSAVVAAEDGAGRPTAAALLIKARVEPSVQKGLRILASIGAQSPPEVLRKVRAISLNSLGVLHHRMGRHAIAASYFEQARAVIAAVRNGQNGLAESLQVRTKGTGKPLSMTRFSHDTHIAYNLGLQYMLLGRFRDALAMFSACAEADEVLASTSALLWIRMAECCTAEARSVREASKCISVEGRGKGRRFVLRSLEKSDISLLKYAAACARAALAVLDRQAKATQDASKRQKQAAGTQSSSSSTGASTAENGARGSQAPLTVVTMTESHLRCAALALLAYSSLDFDADAAVVACDELVNVSIGVDPERNFLGRLYGAEAHCLLGSPDDAVDMLAPLLAISSLNHTPMRDAGFVNVALAHSIRGDSVSATRAAKAALKVTGGQDTRASPRREALLVAAYIFLRDNDMDNARQVLHTLRM